MKKSKPAILALIALLALSSCGIFKKKCDCPVFKAYKQPVKVGVHHA